MELKIRITKHAHFRTVKPLDLDFFGNANRRDEIADLEPHECHHEAKYRYGSSIDQLHEELRQVTIQKPAHTVRAVDLHHLVAYDAIPAGAVLTGRKYPDGDYPPKSVYSVDGNSAHRIVNAASFPEENGLDHEPTGNQANDRRRPG